MACVMCEHCHSPVIGQEELAIRKGFSYHKDCFKCYVCSETDLHRAEVFKGVIFCYSCAKRIFQGCASAKKTKQKVNGQLKTRSRSRTYTTQGQNEHSSARRSKQRDSSKKSRSKQPRNKTKCRTITPSFHGVIERAEIGGSTSESVSSKTAITAVEASKPAVVAEMFHMETNRLFVCSGNGCKKTASVEVGITTDVTQELLQQINDFMSPNTEPSKVSFKKNVSPVDPLPKPQVQKERKTRRHRHRSAGNSPVYSDLRTAELGISTEIANMALRKKSEVPVIIKSDHHIKDEATYSLTAVDHASDISSDESMDSAYSSLSVTENPKCLDRRLRSILKLPYTFFKKKILTRSSLVNMLMSTRSVDESTYLEKFKMMFYEEVAEHRGRGMQRLYSTINRRKTPYRLGWVDHVANLTCSTRGRKRLTQSKIQKRRKHLNSHSYRCMRAHVMRLAGPTNSQLASFRCKVLPPPAVRKVVRNIVKFFGGPVGDSETNVRHTNYELKTVFEADSNVQKITMPWKTNTCFHLYSMKQNI